MAIGAVIMGIIAAITAASVVASTGLSAASYVEAKKAADEQRKAMGPAKPSATSSTAALPPPEKRAPMVI